MRSYLAATAVTIYAVSALTSPLWADIAFPFVGALPHLSTAASGF